MTKYLHDQPEHGKLWRHDEVLDNDLERMEHDKNFEQSDVYNSILDDEPAYHSLMNFPEEEEDRLYANAYEEDNVFEDRDSYKNADQDDIYYFI
jgi:hypothetical protein